MVVMVMKGSFPINQALNVPKFLHVARNCDGTLLIESIFLFRFLQKLDEQRVIKVYHRHYKSLLFFPLPNSYCQTPLWYIS